MQGRANHVCRWEKRLHPGVFQSHKAFILNMTLTSHLVEQGSNELDGRCVSVFQDNVCLAVSTILSCSEAHHGAASSAGAEGGV